MTAFKVGDRVRAVQCDENRIPCQGGKVLPGTITTAEGAYYGVRYDDRGVYSGRNDPYWKESLWRAWSWDWWRLEHLDEAEQAETTEEQQ